MNIRQATVFTVFSLFSFFSLYTLALQSSSKHITNVDKLMEQAQIPGMSAAIIRNGRIDSLVTRGISSTESKELVTHNTLFEAASLSKPVLAYITLSLVEEGVLTLDTPLAEYLEYERFSDKDKANKLTARLVLTHQTGLPNWGGEQLDFIAEPGAQWGYSGEGFVYLQRAIEQLTKKDLQTLAAEMVFKPLGMTDSYFTWEESFKVNRADGHDRTGSAVSRDIPDANAAYSLHTTAQDYARFVLAWFAQDRWPENGHFASFQSLKMVNGDEQGASLPLPDDNTLLSWGLGWGIEHSQQKRIAWHWGDNGVFRAFVAFDVNKRDGFVYFTNSENGLAIGRQFAESIVGKMDNTFHFLQYGQSDQPGWQAQQQAHMALARDDLEAAIHHFSIVSELHPENERVKTRIDWLAQYRAMADTPFRLAKAKLDAIVGTYGQRKITRENDQLFYQRNGGQTHALTPMSEELFRVGNMYDFRISVEYTQDGKANKLVGQYVNGYRDQSPRTEL